MKKDFDTDVELDVLKAFLVEGKSHREIQRDILGFLAPARGGGFVTMNILQKYGNIRSIQGQI